MATSVSTSLDPLAQDYYNNQVQKVNDTYQIGQWNNQDAQHAADLSYSQKLSALQDKLTQQRNAMPDKFAARGMLNSGTYNYGSNAPEYSGSQWSTQTGMTPYDPYSRGQSTNAGIPGSQLGAQQQFTSDSSKAQTDLNMQQAALDNQYAHQLAGLGKTSQDDLNSIYDTSALDAAQQSVSAAITGAGF